MGRIIKTGDYTFAVASVRIKEISLLTDREIAQLISAPDGGSVKRLLESWGWSKGISGDDDLMLDMKLIKTWEFIEEIMPNINIMDSLIIGNDFHNLKASLRCFFCGEEPDELFIEPAKYNPYEIYAAIKDKDFSLLPQIMQEPAELAYETYVKTQDSRYMDVYIDRATLAAILNISSESGKFFHSIAEIKCAGADIKIALRSLLTHRDEEFMKTALCPCSSLDVKELRISAKMGIKELEEYLKTTVYSDAAELLGNKSALERWFDNAALQYVSEAKYIQEGPEPVAAYYMMSEAEIRNIRIILSGKRADIPESVLQKRMRRIYV